MEEILDSLRLKYSEEGKRLIFQARKLLSDYAQDSALELQFEELFRIMHTLKGNSAMFQQPEVEAISKNLESIFDLLKTGKLKISDEIIDVALISLSHIEIIIESGKELSRNQWKNHSLLLTKLTAILKSASVVLNTSQTTEKRNSRNIGNFTFSFFRSKNSLLIT